MCIVCDVYCVPCVLCASSARCVLCAKTNVKRVLMFVMGVSVSVMSLFQRHTHTCDVSDTHLLSLYDTDTRTDTHP